MLLQCPDNVDLPLKVKDIYFKTPSELSLVSCDSTGVSQERCVLSFIISLPLTVADVAILCFMK